MPFFFLMRGSNRVDGKGVMEELGGVGIKEVIIRIYYVREKLFSIKERKSDKT